MHTTHDLHTASPPPKKKHPRGFLWCGFFDGVRPQISCESAFFLRCQRENTDCLPSERPPLVLDGWIKGLERKSFLALCFGEKEGGELGGA